MPALKLDRCEGCSALLPEAKLHSVLPKLGGIRLCDTCCDALAGLISDRRFLGDVMRISLPLEQQEVIRKEKALAYAQAEVPKI